MTSRSFYGILPYGLCLVACLTANLFYFPQATLFPDEQRFLASAVRLATTGEFWAGGDRAWEMPGTALFFTPAVWLFGTQGAILPIRLLQTCLLLVQCGLIVNITRRTFGQERTGLIAACITAIYPFFIFYQGLLLSETLFNTLLLAGFAAMLRWRDRGARIDGALALTCACFAAATMTKASLTILPPLLIATTAWLTGLTWRRGATILLTAGCLYAAFLGPWIVRNALVLGHFVPFTTSSGQNLYLGNNPRNPDAGVDWGSNVDPAVVARLTAIPDEVERQRAFSREATDYIKSHPAEFMAAAVKKLFRFWNVFTNAPEYRGSLYSILAALSFAPIFLLAIAATFRQRRQWRYLAPFYIVAGYFTLLHVVTVASLRYRLPLEPLMIVLAAEPLGAMFAWWQRRASPADATP